MAVSVVQREGLTVDPWVIGEDISWFSTRGSYVSFAKNKNLVISHEGNRFCYLYAEKDNRKTQPNYYRKEGYTSTGTATCKSGAILVCLWNDAMGDSSHGLVVHMTLKGDYVFEIESEKNRRLFTCPIYVTENGNEDVCVSDVDAVVVTDRIGMFRFRFTGHLGDPQFDPYGICCDFRCNIIIADMKNDKIHVIDEDGAFLYYIQYEGMKMPRALCIDENDHLYVGEWNCDVIKVISRD